MVTINQNERNALKNIVERSGNSLLFENSSEKTLYINKELKHYRESSRNLIVYKPFLLCKYAKTIRKTAYRMYLTQVEIDNYYCDPKKFSLEKLGSTDYWYIVLMLNNMFTPSEFHTFSNGVLVPDRNTISNLITLEERKV